ncbi:MAG: site-specific integrase, partial [Burkholderiaceae bacterium]|nr:site-specific integrase [Burkholderiaceae bacterium]
MGHVKQRGDGWRAFVQRGKYRPTKTFSTKREALDWIIAEEAACLAGERGAGTGAQTVADAIDRYLASADLGRSERTRLAVFRR